jgi:F-type H+-transporting ATPase subunit b
MYELLLLLALIILAVVIWKTGLAKMVTGILDDHAEKVHAELDEARALREEAVTLLAEHQTRLAGGEEQARKIAAQAEAEARRLAERHKAELKASLTRREEQALARIAQEEAKALQALRSRTAKLAILTTRHLLREKMVGERGQSLLDSAIGEVSRKLA